MIYYPSFLTIKRAFGFAQNVSGLCKQIKSYLNPHACVTSLWKILGFYNIYGSRDSCLNLKLDHDHT